MLEFYDFVGWSCLRFRAGETAAHPSRFADAGSSDPNTLRPGGDGTWTRPTVVVKSVGRQMALVACIAGGIAEAYWGVPDKIAKQTLAYLDDQLRKVVEEFVRRFGVSKCEGNV
jgi:hypothetical protein